MSTTDDPDGRIDRGSQIQGVRWATKVLDLVLAVTLVAMLVLLILEIIARNFLDTSTLIADEYSAYGLVIIGFLGLGRALSTGSHVRVGALLALVSKRKRIRQALEIFSAIALLTFALIGVYQLGTLALESWQRGTTAPTITRTPIFIPQTIATAGFFLLGTSAVSYLVRIMRGEKLSVEGESQEVDQV